MDAVIGRRCVPYATLDDLPEGCPCRTLGSGSDEPSDERLTELLDVASEILWTAWAYPTFGPCEVTIHPCRRGPGFAPSAARRRSTLLYGGCSCCGCEAVILPGPVYDIVEVIIDGAVLAPSEYELHGGTHLVRPESTWPTGGGPASDQRFVVTYEMGVDIPVLARDATVELANYLWTARCENRDNRLSRAVTGVTTPGVSMSFSASGRREAARAVEQFANALPLCQASIATYNPTGTGIRTAVWSPDLPYENRHIRTFS